VLLGPQIAVPTSVGYGAALGGISPLLSALTAGAPGVATVNIDNGFGGGCCLVPNHSTGAKPLTWCLWCYDGCLRCMPVLRTAAAMLAARILRTAGKIADKVAPARAVTMHAVAQGVLPVPPEPQPQQQQSQQGQGMGTFDPAMMGAAMMPMLDSMHAG
jgi:hypothetical protein